METVLRIWPRRRRTAYRAAVDRTIGAQTVEHAGVKHYPRGHIQIVVDRFMRDPHRHVFAKLLSQPLGDLLR